MKRKYGYKDINILLCFLILSTFCIVGCSKQNEEIPISESTTFEFIDIALRNDTAVITGGLKLGKEDGVLLSIEAKEDTKGTFSITYTKDKGSPKINLNNKQLLTLKKGEAKDIESDTIHVDLKKGINDFLLVGDACNFDYEITLVVKDRSLIKYYRGGTVQPLLK